MMAYIYVLAVSVPATTVLSAYTVGFRPRHFCSARSQITVSNGAL